MNLASLVILSILAQITSQTTNSEVKVQAQSLLKEGTRHYEQGEFSDALDKFEHAYALYPSPRLIFNIGKANRELRRPVDALEAFEHFLSEAKDVPQEMIAEAKRSVTELSLRTGKLLIDCPAVGAEIAVDGKKVGQAPVADFVRVMPGSHQVTATLEGMMPAIDNVNVIAGTVQSVAIRMRSLAEAATPSFPAAPAPAWSAPAPTRATTIEVQATRPTAPPVADEGWLLGRKWTWVAAGSAVVFTTGAVIAGMAMQSKFDDLKRSCGKGSGPNYTGCSASDLSSLDTRKDTANVFWGLSAAALATAGVLFYFEDRSVGVTLIAGETTGVRASVRY